MLFMHIFIKLIKIVHVLISISFINTGINIYLVSSTRFISLAIFLLTWTYTGQQKKGYKVICLLFYKTE